MRAPWDEDTAAKIEHEFALHISIIAPRILEREVNIVMVLGTRRLRSSRGFSPASGTVAPRFIGLSAFLPTAIIIVL
ncbi:hypothetical protein XH97_34110 [Bradyrhizobium sp. CCBAU 53380]|nr:hypothetical protein [Bradyrhizobium sp. CCBAU 53380]